MAFMKPIPTEMIKTYFRIYTSIVLKKVATLQKNVFLAVPSQHYFMGGIDVDKYSKTSMTDCTQSVKRRATGVHGKIVFKLTSL